MKNVLDNILKLGWLRVLLILALIDIIVFVNFNDSINKHLLNLIYYFQFYFIVLGFIKFNWGKHKDVLTRSLLIALGFYYLFHLGIQTIEIFNPELKRQLYRGKTINYILALSCGCSLILLPLILKLKKWMNAKESPSLKK